LLLLEFSQQTLQDALDQFSAACNHAGLKTSTTNTEVFCLSRNSRHCELDAVA